MMTRYDGYLEMRRLLENGMSSSLHNYHFKQGIIRYSFGFLRTKTRSLLPTRSIQPAICLVGVTSFQHIGHASFTCGSKQILLSYKHVRSS